MHQATRAFLDVELAQPHDCPTVVVTHHAPHPDSLRDRHAHLAWCGASDLTGMIEARGPDLWVHGHVHHHADHRIGRTRISLLVAWAVSTLVVVYLLSSAVGGAVSGASSAVSGALGGAGNLIGGSVKTAAQAAAPSLPGMDNPFSNIESSVRNGTGNDPEALKNAAVSAMRAAVTGDAAQQKDAQEKAAQALAKAQGIPVDQARTQVADYTKQFNDTVAKAKAKDQAKQAADTAARVGAQGALYGALALILGAVAAFLAGRGGAKGLVADRGVVAPVGQRRV